MPTPELSPIIQSLLERPDLPALALVRNSDAALLKRLVALAPASLVAPAKVKDEQAALLLKGALLLWHDFLDESHKISQQVETQDGSYWHGIMHRREPDAGNAAYWFRRVGTHPIFPALHAAAKAIAPKLIRGAAWDPFAFIDLCEQARFGRDAALDAVCRNIQKTEFNLLLAHTYRRTAGA